MIRACPSARRMEGSSAGGNCREKKPLDEEMVALITGSGLKTMDAVEDTIRVTTIDATVSSFDEMMMGAVA